MLQKGGRKQTVIGKKKYQAAVGDELSDIVMQRYNDIEK